MKGKIINYLIIAGLLIFMGTRYPDGKRCLIEDFHNNPLLTGQLYSNIEPANSSVITAVNFQFSASSILCFPEGEVPIATNVCQAPIIEIVHKSEISPGTNLLFHSLSGLISGSKGMYSYSTACITMPEARYSILLSEFLRV
jgi:hypothetical protein